MITLSTLTLCLTSLLFLSSPIPTLGGIQLPTIIGNSMVIQRNQPFLLWGTTNTPTSAISVDFQNQNFKTTSDNTGYWSVTLPSSSAQATPQTLTITGDNDSVSIQDIVIGDVYVCSGQSNCELAVDQTVNASVYVANSGTYGSMLRLLQVALENQYDNITSPLTNVTMNIPWSRANPSNTGSMSAMCYYYGLELLATYPDVPIGMIASSWGGTSIEPWMSPESLHSCGEESYTGQETKSFSNPDPGIFSSSTTSLSSGFRGTPTLPSTLYYSMIYPLLTYSLTGFLWYQGESNAGNPVNYSRCFPAMISQWRNDWNSHTNGATDINAPFIFVQLSSWPSGNTNIIATQRYAQTAALALPKVGMVVTADIGDPSGAFHPIHPPFKYELARRAVLWAQNIIYGNTSSPTQGPMPVNVIWDAWNASWGNYHYNYGGNPNNVCSLSSNGFVCGGIRITFDQPIVLKPSYGGVHGYDNGFQLCCGPNTTYGIPATQPVTLTGIRTDDPYTIQLNVTWTYGTPGPKTIYYGWNDYPTMFLYNNYDLPVPPFNITIPY